MHGFKLLFSNWTPNTCEEAYMSILSIRRHLTFLRLHTLCSKLLSCCCFYCHYDAYTSQLVIGSRSHHTSHSGGTYSIKSSLPDFLSNYLLLFFIYLLRDFQTKKNTISTILWIIYVTRISNSTLTGQWLYNHMCKELISTNYFFVIWNCKLQIASSGHKGNKNNERLIVAIVVMNLEWLDPWTPDKWLQF